MSDAPVAAKPKKKKKIEDWEVEDALRTLKQAEKIREDEEMMKLVEKHAKKEVRAIRSIADLRKRRDELDEQA